MANNERINIDLMFNANIGQAKQQLQELKTSLDSLSKQSSFDLPIGNQLNVARANVSKLQVALEKATDSAGNLDISKFYNQMKQFGLTTGQVRKELEAMGPGGAKAFQQLAISISNAEIPVRKLNGLVKDFGVTLKNTLKWQISATALNSITSILQNAIRYSKDLNSSLNDIRIVTGASIEDMAKFAKEANKAAKALSTTTTEYTKASLIYFQQGLSEQEVKNRTDITVKMANVTSQSAQKVSDQMTAIWNNFYDGSKSLEYYADVLTTLGAATASSSSEISEGLEKFASVADTVGLSYEYAASALATVTATTRQSADVVGTAFKTLFARIQDLELGKTLDDGTTLGQYSKALAAIGVDIKTTNGQIKDMDAILNEMGSKWKNLSKDTQVAVAQSVAGTRQYTQLVALMDNWDYFQSNLSTAKNSEGTLQKQADIYAESWEAASKRVKAATEKLFDKFLNDEFIIDIVNGFEKFLNVISNVTDSLGGMKGVLLLISSLVLKTFGGEIYTKMQSFGSTLMTWTTGGRKKLKEFQTTVAKQGAQSYTEYGNDAEDEAKSNVASRQAELRDELNQQTQLGIISESERLAMEKRIGDSGAGLVTAGQNYDQARAEVADARKTLLDGLSIEQTNQFNANIQNAERLDTSFAEYETYVENLIKELDQATGKEIQELQKKAKKKAEEFRKKMGEDFEGAQLLENFSSSGLNKAEKERAQQAARDEEDPENAKKRRGSKGRAKTEAIQNLEAAKTKKEEAALKKKLATQSSGLRKVTKDQKKYAKAVEDAARATGKSEEEVQAYTKAQIKSKKAQEEYNKAQEDFNSNNKAIQKDIKGLTDINNDLGKSILTGVQGLSSFAMGISALSGAWDTLNNKDMSFLEKTLSLITSLSVGVPMLISGFTQTITAVNSIKNAVSKANAVMATQLMLTKGKTDAEIMKMLVEKKGYTQEAAGIILEKAKNSVEGQGIRQKFAYVAASGAKIIGMIAEKVSLGALTGAEIAAQVAGWPLLVITLALAAAFAALALVVAGVAALFSWASDMYNKDALAAERAEAAAEALAEAYKTCKEEYENMIQAMDNYKSAREGLDSLTKGTEEYRKALLEANKAGIELLKNGSFTNEDYRWENGELIIEKDAMERIEQEKAKQISTTYYASEMASIQATKARAKSDLTDMRREQADDVSGAEWAGAAILLSTGTLPLMGIAQAKANYFDEAYNELHDAMVKNDSVVLDTSSMDAFKASVEALGTDIDTSNGELMEALYENAESLNKLDETVTQANELQKAVAQSAVNDMMANNEQFQSTEEGRKVIEGGGRVYQDTYEKLVEEYKKVDIANDFTDKGTDEAKKLWKKYAEVAGIKNAKVDDYDSDNYVYFIDSEGNEKQVHRDTMAEVVAAAEAGEETQKQLNKQLDIISSINQKTDTGKATVDLLTTGSLEGATLEEIQAFNKAYDLEGDGKAALEKILGHAVTQEDLDAFGYESTEEWVEELKKAQTNAEQAINDIDSEVTSRFRNISLSTAQSLENAFKEAKMGPAGEFGAKAYLTGIKNIVGDAGSKDQIEQAYNNLLNLDWNNVGGVDDIRKAMEEAGVAVDATDEELQRFWEQAKKANGVLPINEVKKFTENLQNLYEILGDKGLQLGDLITKEQYELLVKYNNELEKYFTLNASGKYQYTGTDGIDMKDVFAQAEYKKAQKIVEASRNAEKSGVLDTTRRGEATTYDFGVVARQGENWITSNGGWMGGINNILSDKNLSTIAIEGAGYDKARIKEIQSAAQEVIDKAAKEGRVATKDELESTGLIDLYAAVGEVMDTTGQMSNADLAEQKANLENDISEINNILLYSKNLTEEERKAYEARAMYLNEKNRISELDNQAIEEYSKSLQKGLYDSDQFSVGLRNNEEAAREAAIAQMRQKNSLDALNDGFINITDTLFTATKGTSEYLEALTNLKGILTGIFNIDMDDIDDTWLSKNIDTIYSMIKNQDVSGVQDLIVERAVENALGVSGLSLGQEKKVNDIQTRIYNDTIGSTYGKKDLEYQSVSNLIEDDMTEEQVTSLLQAFGLEGNIVKTEDGSWSLGVLTKVSGVSADAFSQVSTEIAKNENNLKNVVEKYRLVNYQLDQNARLQEKAGRAAEEATGKNKLDALSEQLALMEDEDKLLEKKDKENKQHLEESSEIAKNYAKSIGIEFGNVIDWNDPTSVLGGYTEGMYAIQDAIDQAIAEGDYATANRLSNELATLQEFVDSYQEEVELSFEIADQLEENFVEKSELRITILEEYMAQTTNITEKNLEKLQKKFELLENDAFKASEALALMYNTTEGSTDQLDLIDTNLATYTQAFNDLAQLKEDGKITDADYEEMLATIEEAYGAEIDKLIALDETMREYYGNTIQKANEEIGKYTSQMEAQNAVLDHYLSLNELMGRQKNYDWIGKVLAGQAKLMENNLTVSRTQYQMYEEEVAKWQKQVANAKTDEESTFAKQQLEAAITARNEAQDKMLSDTEAWLEAEKALLENEIAEQNKILEDSLVGEKYRSFDQINTSLERSRSLQEEYLTTTNKVYETTKMMRNVQQEIEKTNNTIAKQRLKEFVDSTKELQSKNKLSQTELDIQQAKYDLLLAEIALEEAQNAKSQVRLRRDSEGNFGYIYTANQSNIAQAQQAYDDAENALYNLQLEKTNEYAEKAIQTRQEMYDTLAEINQRYIEGEFADENEYQDAMTKAKEYYYDKLKEYADLHTISLGDDARIVNEAWSGSFTSLVQDTESWTSTVEKYLQTSIDKFAAWNSKVDNVAKENKLDDIETQIGDITTANEKLKKELVGEDGTGGVISLLKEELAQVDSILTKYQERVTQNGSIIQAYKDEQLALQNVNAELGTYDNYLNKILEKQGYVIDENGDIVYNPTNENKEPHPATQVQDSYKGGSVDPYANTVENPEYERKEDTESHIKKYDVSIGSNPNTYYFQKGVDLPIGASSNIYATKNGSIPTGNTIKVAKEDKVQIFSLDSEAPVSSRFGYAKIYDSDKGDLKGQGVVKFKELRKYLYQSGWDAIGNKEDSSKRWLSDQVFGVSYDTGGYTGAWGPEGKWAMLHQKEIVLNAQDSENLLAAVDILRQIVSVIDIQSQYNQLANTLIPSVSSYNNNGIEQNVHIEASFPSVTDHNEIELALRNIVNEASQYINRK